MRPFHSHPSSSILTVLALMWMIAPTSAEVTLHLGTDIMPPYLFENPDQSLDGDAKGTLDCVFDRLPQYQYQTAIAPWPRVVRLANRGDIDGWFLYVQNASSDVFAVLSDPLLLESWYWYSLDDITSATLEQLKDETVLVMNGTYQEIWLQGQGFTDFLTVPTTDSLIRAFLAGRARHLLVSESVFNEALGRLNGQMANVNRRFVGFIPLGLYITDAFAIEHPGFIDGFNAAASGCRIEQMGLTPENEQALSNLTVPLARWLAADWVLEPVLLANAKNRYLSADDIDRADRQWMDEVASGEFDMIREVLGNELSSRLSLILRQSQGVFSELFITDVYGTLVGSSGVTSDWFQGDESPYAAIVAGQKSVHIDAIAYDQSTRQFLSQLSLPIYDRSGEVVGMLVAGVNVENALQGLR